MEGELIHKFQVRLKLEGNGKLFLLWPETICHVIDKDSPLYELSAQQLLGSDFEIGVSIVGDSRKTGQFVQARTSYVPSEVFWGHRFVNTIDYDKVYDEYVIDMEKFNKTIPVGIPLCSAKRLDEIAKGMEFDPNLEALRDFKIKDTENEDDEEDDEEEEHGPGYSEETDMDVVKDMLNTPSKQTKGITRTTSVVQNFNGSRDYVPDFATDYSKSLTHIERERERMLRPLSLKKSRARTTIKLQNSDESNFI